MNDLIADLFKAVFVLASGIVIVFAGLVVYFTISRNMTSSSKCKIEFVDSSQIEAVGCFAYRDDINLRCDGGKAYSLYGVKSWQCR